MCSSGEALTFVHLHIDDKPTESSDYKIQKQVVGLSEMGHLWYVPVCSVPPQQ